MEAPSNQEPFIAPGQVDDFFAIVHDAARAKATRLEELRRGVNAHQDFASLNMQRESWIVPVIFEHLYELKNPSFVLTTEAPIPGIPRKRFDITLEAQKYRADFEVKGWWPGVRVRDWRTKVKTMAKYPPGIDTYFLLLVRADDAHSNELDTLNESVSSVLNALLKEESLPGQFALTHLKAFGHDLGTGNPRGPGKFGVALVRFYRVR